MKQFRQGDVFIRQIEVLPTNLKPKQTDANRTVLAYGEVTGHAHAFYTNTVSLFESNDINETKAYLKVNAVSELKHEEHSTITLVPGNYEVIQQQEYVMGEIKRVAD